VPTTPALANAALRSLRDELELGLQRARSALETHAESREETALLDSAAAELNQVRGTLALLRLPAGERYCRELLALLDVVRSGSKPYDDAALALGCASLRLSGYLDLLADGEADDILLLAPAINEVRSARGDAPLAESELFASQAQAGGWSTALPEDDGGLIVPRLLDDDSAQALARRELPAFQAAFLQWFKGLDGAAALATMSRIGDGVAGVATDPRLRSLWLAHALLADSLRERAGEAVGLDLKRLVGRAGSQLKTLADHGESAAVAQSADSLWLLAHALSQWPAASERTRLLLDRLDLAARLPSPARLASLRSRLAGPGTAITRLMHAEIRREFATIKDGIDLAVRTAGQPGQNTAARLEPTLARLALLASTLVALGLESLPAALLEQRAKLAAASGDGTSTAPDWMAIAAALLRIELSLDDSLLRATDRHRAPLDEATPARRELAEGRQALLRELLADCGRIRADVERGLRDGDGAAFEPLPGLLHEIGAALAVAGDDVAAGLVARIEQRAHQQQPTAAAAAFVDALAALEAWIEARRSATDPQALFAGLARAVDRLAGAAVVSAVPAPAPVAEQAPSSDPELRDIFIEEAGEVLATLQASLPAFRRDPGHRDTLATVRRAFHTLKGSGRTVGARAIGDFGWALENLLNRCIDGERAADVALITLVDDAVRALPALIASFRDGQDEEPAVAELIGRAERLASGRGGAEVDVRTLFGDDAREQLGAVRLWLEAQAGITADVAIPADTVRALHTLRGSAAVVNAVAVSRLAAQLEAALGGLRLRDQGLPAAAQPLLLEAVHVLRDWIDGHGSDRQPPDEAADAWTPRLATLDGSPAAEAGPVVDSGFALAALDALQAAEAALRDQAGARIASALWTAAGLAADAGVAELATMAGALANRLGAWTDAAFPPADASLARELETLLEGLFRRLDQYRDGSAVGLDVAVWLDRVAALPSPPPLASATDSLPATAAEPIDPELREIFLGEGQELLEALAITGGLWSGADDDAATLAELRRNLHTLKGSARMAGADALGELAHRIESMLERPAGHAAAQLLAAFETGLDGLQRQLDQLRDGVLLPADGILAAVDAALGLTRTVPPAPALELVPAPEPEPEAAPAPAPIIATALADEPSFELLPPLPAEAPEPAWQPEPPPTITPRSLPAAASAYDNEIGEIFSAEAAELLDVLDAGFEAWQNGNSGEPVNEILRALHTLKGGARMAGLDAMAHAAHDLESQVGSVVATREFPDAARFASLRAGVETLQHLHDRLRRGEAGEPLIAAAQAVIDADAAADDRAVPAAVVAPQPPATAPATAAATLQGWAPELFWKPDDEAGAQPALRRESARVPVDLLDAMLNQAGETAIVRSRLEEHHALLKNQLGEIAQTITRIRDQLRLMDIETEAQIAARGRSGSTDEAEDRYASEFDALEMDRYSRMQELSRALTESIGDLGSLHGSMDEAVGGADSLLQQQGRITTELQQGLMGTLMVPFARQSQRLLRVVRQTALENGKEADLSFAGADAELDRNVLERMTAPLEHLLRNAVVHGIEAPQQRRAAGKPIGGTIRIALAREGAQLLVEVSDDGAGLDYAAIRRKAVERGLIAPDTELSNEALGRFILEAGFSTARRLTQDAGRGIGMDVVANQVKQLGGTLELRSEAGVGTRFLIRLPLTLAVSQALLVGVGPETYALPLTTIEGVGRIARKDLPSHLAADGPLFEFDGQRYRVRHLGDYVDLPRGEAGDSRSVGLILVHLGEGLALGSERRIALVVDRLLGNREIVTKSAGPQLSSVAGISGATILADGSVAMILDVPALVADRDRRSLIAGAARPAERRAVDRQDTVLVVDDSITMRRVAERVLSRHGYKVLTAKDGLDAMAVLHTELPSVVLLDIEMPRADGFEVAAFIRNSERLARLPIIMITSRSGEKHRARARQLGVDRYLTKPYQEEQLLAEVRELLGATP